jgi:opacity protein-like surface antigen
MRKLLLLTTLLTTPAFGADLNKAVPLAPVYSSVSWQGLYFSGYGLYGANITNTDISSGGIDLASLASSPHGFGLGGALGYYFQAGGLVWGPRVDLAYANMQGGSALTGGTLSVSNATNYLGDADLIVGLPLGDSRLLAYLGAGFAFGGAKPNLTTALTLPQAASDTSTGWNVLGGLAYQLSPNWQVFIEGDYFQLGDKSLTATTAGGTPIATSLTKYHIVEQKFGLSYKF